MSLFFLKPKRVVPPPIPVVYPYHSHFFRLFCLKDKLNNLYEHMLLRAFAIACVAVFIPVYLLNFGFPLQKVFVYLCLEWGFFGFLTPLYSQIIHNIGVKIVIVIRTIVYCICLGLLFALSYSPFLQEYWYIIPILMGAGGSLYTLSISTLFAQLMGKERHGAKVAKIQVLEKLSSLVAPFVGGVISAYFGFHALFILVIVVLLLSLIPVFVLPHDLDHPPFHFKIFVRFLEKDLKDVLILFAYGVTSLSLFILLPIAIYLVREDSMVLGAFVSGIALLSAGFSMIVGKWIDGNLLRTILKISCPFLALFFLGLSRTMGTTAFLWLSLFSGLISVLVNIPIETYLYQRSHSFKSFLEFFAFKEFGLFLGRFLLLLFLATGLVNFEHLFFGSGVVSLLFFFL